MNPKAALSGFVTGNVRKMRLGFVHIFVLMIFKYQTALDSALSFVELFYLKGCGQNKP